MQLAQHRRMRGQTRPDAVFRVLIRAGAELEAEIEQPLRVVRGLTMPLHARQRPKAAARAARHLADENLVVVMRLRLQTGQRDRAGVIAIRARWHWRGGLIEIFRVYAITHRKLARPVRPRPDSHAVFCHETEHRPVGDMIRAVFLQGNLC